MSDNEPLLSIKGLNVSIQSIPILHDVTIDLPLGATVGLVGRNGAGKTTLMRSIMGLLNVESGRIDFENTDLLNSKPHKRALSGIGYMPEDRRLVPQFTVEENILVPMWATKTPPEKWRLEWIYELMPEIARFKDRQALSLSGGQQKLVALGRALLTGQKLLLLDEPFEGVAPALAQRLMEVISSLKNENLSVLISESDFTHSKKMVEKVFSIERGHINEISDS